MCRSRFAATTLFVRRFTLFFCTTRFEAGMDMGIVNAGQLAIYADLPGDLRDAVEDVVLNRRDDATERLLDVAENYKGQASGAKAKARDLSWRELTVDKATRVRACQGY